MSKSIKPQHKDLKEIRRLLKIVHELRTRCPWDKKQTHRSLVRYFLEETYEAVDAIQERDDESLKEELGDVLLQVALHCEIARERGQFGFGDVARGISDKMVRRHPHVYQKLKVKNAKEHQRNWAKLKDQEKPHRGLMEGIPKAMPALQLAQRYGEIAGTVGFDWESAAAVFKKVREEVGELETEIKKGVRQKKQRDKIEMELGDVFFTLANLGRHLGVDSESALKRSSKKFSDRFRAIEMQKQKEGKRLVECSLSELDALWEEIKRREGERSRAGALSLKPHKGQTKSKSIRSE